MKLLFFLFSVLALAGCSSDGGSGAGKGGGGVVTEFGKKLAGEWTSDCMTGEQGPYIETLTIQSNGTGHSVMSFYQNQNCSGAIKETQGPNVFTYSSEDLADGSARLSLSRQGQTSQVTVTVIGNVMDVKGQNGQARYIRSQKVQEPVAPNQDDFDRLAIGSWISEQCFPFQNNTSARQQLNIIGRGSANVIIQVYQSSNCSGRSRAERPQAANYRVDHFANGQGQVSVNGEPSEISFQGARNDRMTVTNPNGTVVYNKVN